MKTPRRYTGFTLIEVLIVLITVGILAAGTTVFIAHTARSYVDIAEREQLSTAGRIAIERMTRELRDALPNSVRVDSNARCVEFLPAVGGGLYAGDRYYQQNASDPINLPTSGHQLHAFGLLGELDEAQYVAIYPIDTRSIYDASASDWPMREITPEIALPANQRFVITMQPTGRPFPPRLPSDNARLFLVGVPVSFCIQNNNLYRYSGYALAATQSVPPSGSGVTGRLLLEDLDADTSSFAYDPGDHSRFGIVSLRLSLQRPSFNAQETLHLSHEVHVRNAP